MLLFAFANLSLFHHAIQRLLIVVTLKVREQSINQSLGQGFLQRCPKRSGDQKKHQLSLVQIEEKHQPWPTSKRPIHHPPRKLHNFCSYTYIHGRSRSHRHLTNRFQQHLHYTTLHINPTLTLSSFKFFSTLP